MHTLSDEESILTEDFVNKFNDISVPKASTTQSKPTTLSALKKPKTTDDCDESVTTEDFESRFRSYLIKPTSDLDLHDTWKGSEISARSQRLKDRVSSMFNIGSDPTHLPDANDEVRENEALDRKIEEILARRKQEREGAGDRLSRSKTLPRNVKLHEKTDDDDDSGDEYASEIRSRSRQIKRELELERFNRHKRLPSPRRVSPSPHRTSPVQKLTPTKESVQRKVHELDQLTQSLRRTNQEKDNLLHDVQDLQGTLRKQQAEMRLTEKLIRDNRAKAEDMRTEMSLVELRRNATLKDLTSLSQELDEKRRELRSMEEKMQNHVNNLQELGASRLTKVEMDNIIAERDELYQLLRSVEDSGTQRFQLERQLTLVKDDLRTEQQKAKDRIQSLEEELDASITKITELLRDRDFLREQSQGLERQVRFLEEERLMSQQEMRELKGKFQEEIQRKLEDHEQDRARVHMELRRLEQQRSSNENELREQLHELKEVNKSLRADLQRQQTQNSESRAQLQQLTFDLDVAQKGRNEILSNMERQLRDKDREKENALSTLTDQLTQEKSNLVSQIRQEHDLQIQIMEQKLLTGDTQNRTHLKAKEDEIEFLKERLRKQEATFHHEREEMKLQTREQIRDVLAKEKIVWLEEQKAKWSRELNNLREETTKAVEAAEDAARQQRERANHLDVMLGTMHEELEVERGKNRDAAKEKLNAIRHLKTIAKDELLKEIDRLRAQQSKSVSEEVVKLRDQIDFYAKELTKLKESEDELKEKLSEQMSLLERLQKTVVQEINDECGSIASLLEVKPRQVDLKNYNMMDTSGPLNARTSPITAALANLKACGEEIRAMVNDLREQLAQDSQKFEALEDSQRKDLEEIKRELRVEQSRKLAQTRERLLQEHLKEIERLSKHPDSSLMTLLKDKERELEDQRRHMKMWKLETAEKLASKLQDEFRKEFERKLSLIRGVGTYSYGSSGPLQQRSASNLSLPRHNSLSKSVGFQPRQHLSRQDSGASSVGGPTLLIQQLQDRVKQLREENLGLKRKNIDVIPRLTLSSSNPNLAMSNEELDQIPQRERRPTAMERLEAKVQKAAATVRDDTPQARWSENGQRRSPTLSRMRTSSPETGYSARASTLPISG